MYVRTLRHNALTHRFLILPATDGWEVREELDSQPLKVAHYSDWHRVERAQMAFAQAVDSLRMAGWVEVA
jgi:hypothetical protein